LAGCLLLIQSIFAAEIDTCAVSVDSITFFSQHLNRTLPVHNLNEILLLSVATQSMHGADKTGMAYLIDGVDVSKLMYKNGAFAEPVWPYGTPRTVVNRNGNSLGTPTGQWYAPTSLNHPNGRQANMVNTTIQLTEREVTTVNSRSGTIPAHYSAAGGVVNLFTHSGGDKLTASLNLRSSVGHLNHAGPDVYDNNPNHNPDYLRGKSIAELYQEERDAALQEDYSRSRGEAMTWSENKYNYGDKPRLNGDFTLGGSLGKKLNFFLAADVLNDYGTLPAQFQRNIGASLKLNYLVNPKNSFTLYGKVSDQGKIGGWVNRTFSYMYLISQELNPVNQGLGLMSYAKWQHEFNSNSKLEITVSYVGDFQTWGYKPLEENGELTLSTEENGDNWLTIDTPEEMEYFIDDWRTSIFFHSRVSGSGNYTLSGTDIILFQPYFYYEDMKTENITTRGAWSGNFKDYHLISTGVHYSYQTITHITDDGGGVKYYEDQHIYPWEAGAFIQDQITYRGIQANIGCRIDAYQSGTRVIENPNQPFTTQLDTLPSGWIVSALDYTKKADTVFSLSPRIAIAHPIGKTAVFHYSWGHY
ncbi:hypothetical protein KAH55_06705, partial [bacterium]|nr:hypothetical protein [bacterium]